MLKIGCLELKNNVILAPLAGYTDLPFRLLVKEMSGCGLVCSEMISSEGLVRENKKTQSLFASLKEERPVSLQIFGNNPNVMADAAVILEQEEGPDVIDINFGCPEPKVVRAGNGAALMKNPALLFSIVQKVRKRIYTPLTVKIRSGWDEKNINAVAIAKGCEDCGADAVIVHPRTRSEFFTGHSNWQVIADVKSRIRIPVIGSGDIREVSDAAEMIKVSGCDGVMIGRGAIGRPWFLKEVDYYLSTGMRLKAPSVDEKLDTMLKHIEYFCRYKDEDKAIYEIRKHIFPYLKGMLGAKIWRAEFMGIVSINDMKSFFERVRLGETAPKIYETQAV